MSPIAAALAVAIPAAGVAYLLARRWPHHDAGAPQVKKIEEIAGKVRKYPRLRSLVRSRLDPTLDTGLLLTAALAGVVVSLSAVGLLVRMVRSNSGLAAYDGAFARWGSQHANASSTEALKLVSVLGGYQFLFIASLVVAGLEYRRGRGKSVIALLMLVVAGQFAVANSVKLIVGRARPDLARLTGFSGSSFPSGHAAAAVASFSAFSLLLGRGRSARIKAALASFTLGVSVAVAASRVLLGVHWFTDVLGGLAIGWLWFTVVSLAFGGRILRFGLPVARVEASAGAAIPLDQVSALGLSDSTKSVGNSATLNSARQPESTWGNVEIRVPRTTGVVSERMDFSEDERDV